MRRTTKGLLSIAVLALLPLVSGAQVTPGTPKFGSFGGGPADVVNLQNLNIHIDIPIFSKPGRGMSLPVQVSYDNSAWYPVSGAWQPITNFGWKNPKTGLTGYISYYVYTYSIFCGYMGNTSGTVWQYENWAYVDPFGASHTVTDSVYNVTGNCPPPPNLPSTFTDTVTDGTGFQITATDSSGTITATVYGSDGKTIAAPFFNAQSMNGTNTDSNGNTTSFDGTNFKDTLGMTALTLGGSGTAASPYTFTYTGPGNTGSQTYTMHYSTFTVRTGFGCTSPAVSEYGPNSVALPDYIQVPNGSRYNFQYELTPDQVHYPNDVTGRIASITLPTGGSITYSYTGANDGTNCSDGSTINMTRAVSDGTTSNTWTYARSTSNSTTTITAPQLSYDSAANVTVLTFDTNAHETARKIYQGGTGGTLLRTINTTWAANKTPATVVNILEDGLTQNETDTTYDSYGNLTTVSEYDWGNNARGPLIRTTTKNFINDNVNYPFMYDRVTSQTVKDGNGTIKSRVDIGYDATEQYTTCRTTPVQGHNDAGFPCTFYKRGNPTSTTTYTDPITPSGGTTRYSSYDQLGNVVAADLNCCQRKTWAFSTATQYAYPDSITRGSSSPTLTTSATYDLNMGLVLTATDENLQVTTNTYDGLGRAIDVQRPDSKHIVYAYDDTNHTVQVSSPVQGTDVVRQKTYLDGLGRTIKQQTLDVNNTSYSIVETQYDAVGRGCKVSNPHNSTAQYWTETRYDALGRTTKIIQPDSGQSVFAYSLNTGTVTDAAGKQRKAQTDGLGRLTIAFEPDISNGNALTQQTSYSYNAFDSLTGVTQGVQTRTFVYDALGRLTDATTPESGHFQYQYNSYNLLTQRTDARGVITTYGYDSLNRPTTVSYNVGSTGVPATAGTALTYGTNQSLFNNGQIITLTDGVGSENHSYDSMGNVTQLQKVISGTMYTTSYAYNSAGALTQTTYPSSRVVQQWYDAIGRLCAVATSATSCSPSTYFASGFGYSPAQQVTGFNYGNGVAATFNYYQDMLQLQNLSYAKGVTTLLALSYYYKVDSTNCANAPSGNNGQIQCIKDTTGTLEAGRSVTYNYDPLSRLSTAVTTGSSSFAQWGLSWSYDRYGNRLNQTQTIGNPPTNSLSFASPSGGALTNHPDNMCFDPNGNLMTETPVTPCPPSNPTYSYDAENRLVSYISTGGAYTYDGNGLRVQKTAGGTTTVYIFSGGQVIAEYDNGAAVGSPSREYIYSGGQRIATIQGSATTYLHPDHKSVRVSTDSTGTNVRSFGHYPFGEFWYETGTASKWKFTTYERDSESTNDYAMSRIYVNRFGRFLTTDALPGNVTDPQSLNHYAYVLNDPANLSDPSGNCYIEGFIGGFAQSEDPMCTPYTNCPTDASISCSPYAPLGFGNIDFAAAFGERSRYRAEADEFDFCVLWAAQHGWNPCDNPEREDPWQVFGPGEGIMKQLENILKNPLCASILGGTEKALSLLKNLTIYPTDQKFVPLTTGRDLGTALDVLSGKAPAAVFFGSTSLPLNPWDRKGFTVYTNSTFSGFTDSQKLTVLVHELHHVALGDNVLSHRIDQPNSGRDARRIALDCGTDVPPPRPRPF